MKSLLVAAAAAMLSFGAFAYGDFRSLDGGTAAQKVTGKQEYLITADDSAVLTESEDGVWVLHTRIYEPKGYLDVDRKNIKITPFDDVEYDDNGGDWFQLRKTEGSIEVGRHYLEVSFPVELDDLEYAYGVHAYGDKGSKRGECIKYIELGWPVWSDEDDYWTSYSYSVKFDPATLVLKNEKGLVYWDKNVKIDTFLVKETADRKIEKIGTTLKIGATDTNAFEQISENGYQLKTTIASAVNKKGTDLTKSYNFKYSMLDLGRDYLHCADNVVETEFVSTPDLKDKDFAVSLWNPEYLFVTPARLGAAKMNGHDLEFARRYDMNCDGRYRNETELKVAVSTDVVLVDKDNASVTNWPVAYLDKVVTSKADKAGTRGSYKGEYNEATRTITYSGDCFGDGNGWWNVGTVKFYVPEYVKDLESISLDWDNGFTFDPTFYYDADLKRNYINIDAFVSIDELVDCGDELLHSLKISYFDDSNSSVEPVTYTFKFDAKNITLWNDHDKDTKAAFPVSDDDKDRLGNIFKNVVKTGDRAVAIDTSKPIVEEVDGIWPAAFQVYTPTWAKGSGSISFQVSTYTNGSWCADTHVHAGNCVESGDRYVFFFTNDLAGVANILNLCPVAKDLQIEQRVHFCWNQFDQFVTNQTYTIALGDANKLQLNYADGTIAYPITGEATFTPAEFKDLVVTNNGEIVTGKGKNKYYFPVTITLPASISTNNFEQVPDVEVYSKNWSENVTTNYYSLRDLNGGTIDPCLTEDGIVISNAYRQLLINKDNLAEALAEADKTGSNVLIHRIEYRFDWNCDGRYEQTNRWDLCTDMLKAVYYNDGYETYRTWPCTMDDSYAENASVDKDSFLNISKSSAEAGKGYVTFAASGSMKAKANNSAWKIGQFTLVAPSEMHADEPGGEKATIWTRDLPNGEPHKKTLKRRADGRWVIYDVNGEEPFQSWQFELPQFIAAYENGKSAIVEGWEILWDKDGTKWAEGKTEVYTITTATADLKLFYNDGTTQAYPLKDTTNTKYANVAGPDYPCTNFLVNAKAKTATAVAKTYTTEQLPDDNSIPAFFQMTLPDSVNKFNYQDVPAYFDNSLGTTSPTNSLVSFVDMAGEYDPETKTAQLTVKLMLKDLIAAYNSDNKVLTTTMHIDFALNGKFAEEFTIVLDTTKIKIVNEFGDKIFPLTYDEKISQWKVGGTVIPGTAATELTLSNVGLDLFKDQLIGQDGYVDYGMAETNNVADPNGSSYVAFKIDYPSFLKDKANSNLLDNAAWVMGSASGSIKAAMYKTPQTKEREYAAVGFVKAPSANEVEEFVQQNPESIYFPMDLCRIDWNGDGDYERQYVAKLDLTADKHVWFIDSIDTTKTNVFPAVQAIIYDGTNDVDAAQLATLPTEFTVLDTVVLPDLTREDAMFTGWAPTNVIARGTIAEEVEVEATWVDYQCAVDGVKMTNSIEAVMKSLKGGETITIYDNAVFTAPFEPVKVPGVTYDLTALKGAPTIDYPLTFTVDATILGGSITNNSTITVEGCEVTFKGTAVEFATDYSKVDVTKGGLLTLDGAILTGFDGEAQGALVNGNKGSVAMINGAQIVDRKTPISTELTEAAEIVDGSFYMDGSNTVVSSVNGIALVLGGATAELNGGLVFGQTGVFAVDGTKLVIPDTSTAVVYANGAKNDYNKGAQWKTGDAILVDNAYVIDEKTTGKACALDIAGGAIKSQFGNAIAVYPAELPVAGFVTGGIWGDTSFEDFLAEDYAVMMNTDAATKKEFPFAVDELVSKTYTVVFTECPKPPASISFTKKDLKQGGKYEGGIDLTAYVVEKTGYEFLGWMNTADGQMITVIHNADNYVLAAQWRQLPFDIDEPDPENPADAFTGKKAATYYGNVIDANGILVGTVTLKTSKISNKGQATVSADVTMINKKKYTVKSGKFTADGKSVVENVNLTGKNAAPLNIALLGGYNIAGTIPLDGGELTIKAAVAADDQMIGKAMGNWSVAVKQTGKDGYANFRVSVSNKGKVAIKGNLADGTAISQTAYVVAGTDNACVPFVCAKDNLSFEMWFSGSDHEIFVVNAKGMEGDAVAAYYGTGDAAGLAEGAYAAEFNPEFTVVFKNVEYGFYDANAYVATVNNKGKMKADKVALMPGAKAKTYWSASYTEKTGVFTGKATIFGVNAKQKEVTKSLTLKGTVIDGVVYGTAFIKGEDKQIKSTELEVWLIED